MRRISSSQTAVVGVTVTQLAVQDSLGWVFREQPLEDFGIDAHVEVVDANRATGKLLALQIKSGESYFRYKSPDGWWYRPDADHVKYWTNHSLPVVVVIVDSESRQCYWQLVNTKTLTRSKSGAWKINIPRSNVLDEKTCRPWLDATAGDPYVLRIREMQLAIPWMRILSAGDRLIVDIEEWINKTSGRGSIVLSVDRRDGNPPTRLASWGVYLGTRDYMEAVPGMFRWADVILHPETYAFEDFDRGPFVEIDGERLVMLADGNWHSVDEIPTLRPYRNGAGEVDFYRLELVLNDLRRGLLTVDQFARTGDRQLIPK
ncbi:DUF4365 domain-containing protein [Catellatospora sp. NPDC049111]|uniref:DUF4365 domain-containing protein n=1 Tax=Catellatospora sp. NPDC049111 TaxID=3155271 RepID=UPI0034095DB4